MKRLLEAATASATTLFFWWPIAIVCASPRPIKCAGISWTQEGLRVGTRDW